MAALPETTLPIDPAKLVDGDLRLVFGSFAIHPLHKVPTYEFFMQHVVTGVELGSIRLRIGSTAHLERYAGHIGYLVHPAFQGQGYAGRSVRLLLPIAAKWGIDPLWITCDPENIASRKTLERIGAEFVEIVDVPEDCIIFMGGHPRKCRYRLAVSASPT